MHFIKIHSFGTDIRLIQLAAGVDPSIEPLLSHSGVVYAFGDRVRPAPNGLTGPDPRVRQFLTTTGNDLDPDLLNMICRELNDPAYRASAKERVRIRLDAIHTELDSLPDPEDLPEVAAPPTTPTWIC